MTKQKTQCEPGVYPNLPYQKYDEIAAYRRSVLLKANQTLRHVKAADEEGGDESSEALDFGAALHAAVLEPDRFNQEVVLGEINEKTGEPYGADTKKQEEFRKANPGKIVVSKGYREKLIGMSAGVRNHASAGNLIAGVEETELTIVWDDAETGVRCKARIDMLMRGDIGFVDLKSTVNAERRAFSKSIRDYGYDIQAAMTIDGWAALHPNDPLLPFTIIAAEKESPFAVACYTLGHPSIENARAEYRKVLRGIAEAQATGYWPAYPSAIEIIDVPDWALKQSRYAA